MLNLKIIVVSTGPGRAAAQVIPWMTALPHHSAFGPDGQPGDPRTSATAKILLDDLAWRARALQQARAAGTLPPAALRLVAHKEGAGK